jgi:hypothetical protein
MLVSADVDFQTKWPRPSSKKRLTWVWLATG